MADRTQIEEAIMGCALGDRAAFRTLYQATSAKLFAVSLRVLNDRAEAEDALQEIFVKVWQNAGKYAANGLSPMTWLITVARNHSIDRLRARKASGTSVDEYVDILPEPGPGPEAAAIAASEGARIMGCLGELEPDRAQAVQRAYLDGETYKDLAAAFDVPLNTMRTWLRRSLMKLRDCLSR